MKDKSEFAADFIGLPSLIKFWIIHYKYSVKKKKKKKVHDYAKSAFIPYRKNSTCQIG